MLILLLFTITASKAIDFENSIEVSYQIGNKDYTEFAKMGYVLGLKISQNAVIDLSFSYGRGNALGMMGQKYTSVGNILYTDGFNKYWYQWSVCEAMIGYKYYFNNKDISPFLSIDFGLDFGSYVDNNNNIDGYTSDDYIGLRFKLKDDNAFYVQAGVSRKPYMVEYYYSHDKSKEFEQYRCTMLALKVGFTF